MSHMLELRERFYLLPEPTAIAFMPKKEALVSVSIVSSSYAAYAY